MAMTSTGKALLAASMGLSTLGLVGGYPIAAAVGAGILLALVYARWELSEHRSRVALAAVRTVEQGPHRPGTPVAVRTRVKGNAAGLHLTVEDVPPDGVGIREGRTTAEGRPPLDVTYTSRPAERGDHEWTRVRVGLSDRFGAFRQSLWLPERSRVEVGHPGELLETAERIGRRADLPRDRVDLAPDPLRAGPPAFREYREAMPSRSIDWTHSARLQEPIARTYRQMSIRGLVVLLDASRTMRQRAGPSSRLDRAAELTYQLATAVAQQGVPVGMVAFDEDRIVGEVGPAHGRTAVRRVAEVLDRLPGNLDVARRVPVPSGTGTAGSGRGTMDPSGRAAAFARARAFASASPFAVVLLSDLESHGRSLHRGMKTMAEIGHRVGVLALPDAGFVPPPGEADAAALESAYRAREARDRVERALLRSGGTYLEVDAEMTAPEVLPYLVERSGTARRPTR